MQTRCPQCQTIAPLEADRPQGDTFVCASCGASFDAYSIAFGIRFEHESGANGGACCRA